MVPKEPNKIEKNSVVSFHYTLKNDAGEKLDSSIGEEPMAILYGAGQIVEGLERALEGKGAGDSFEVTVSPEEGYGPKQDTAPQKIDRAQFPDDQEIFPGQVFLVETPQEPMPVWVNKVDTDVIWIDVNHPLAGENLHFSVSVESVRPASEEELSHGHAHGPGGHHH
jgi:FKBP-type peptidyl-prolyl cis-trans isomerase SlyD